MAVAASLMVVACKKTETPEPEPEPTPTPQQPQTTPQPTNPTPTPSDAKGVFAAVKTLSFVEVPGVGTVQTDIGVASAAVWETQGTFIDAGTVSLNNNSLTKNSNNSYAFTPSATSTTGIDLSSNRTWNISGNSTNNVPAISNFNPPIGFPTLGNISGNISTVTKSSGVTLTSAAPINNADSVIFAVHGPSGSAMKTRPGNTTSYSFTSGELANIGAGSGFIQIVSYKIHGQTFSGKKYYFINESVVTKSVTIQ